MRTMLLVGAVLTALSLCPSVVAQASEVAQFLAAAKLHDSRGELAQAEKDLRTALGLATPGERPEVVKALSALLVRQGRNDEAAALASTAPAQQPAAGQDPIQRLIGVLDSGAGTSEPVKDAMAQLTTLGSLALPQLLEALPKLGPFGTANVIDLLKAHDDPRVLATLTQLADGADPTVTATLAGRLSQFQRAVALPLAQKLAEPRFPVGVRCSALAALVAHGAAEADLRALALQLAADSSEDITKRLMNALRRTSGTWVVDTLAVLKDRGTPSERATATVEWLQRQKGTTEELAFAELKKLAPEQVPQCAKTLAMSNPSWVRVALLALPADLQPSGDNALVAKVEWWRLPDESAPLLLRQIREGSRSLTRSNVPHSRNDTNAVVAALGEMTARGWKAPLGLDSAFVELAQAGGGWHMFVAALPVDAEDRALAVWSGLMPGSGYHLAQTVVHAGRPWHRLVARQLAATARAEEVDPKLLDRDWRGAPPEAVDMLVGLAKRWADVLVDKPWQWLGTYVKAYERCPNLPVDGLLPLLGSQSGPQAWEVIVERDPAAALAHARGAAKLSTQVAYSVLELVPEHGAASDVALALRAIEELRHQGMSDTPRLVAFFGRHAAGNLDAVALARTPMPSTNLTRSAWLTIAVEASRGVRSQDLAALLALLPQLQVQCADVLMEAIEPQLAAEHGAALARAVEALLAEPLRYGTGTGFTEPVANTIVLAWLMRCLGKMGDAAAAPVLQRVMALPNTHLVTFAARASLQIAGAGRRALLLDMLQSPKELVVCAALEAEELRTDAELRAAARVALLRLGEQQIADRVDVFRALDAPDALALATAIVEHERFPRFDSGLCLVALQLLGARKDPSLVPTLVRGGRHPDSQVRQVVAYQLGMTFAREAAPPLIEMLKDDHDTVRKAAQEALDQIANYLDARAKWEARLK